VYNPGLNWIGGENYGRLWEDARYWQALGRLTLLSVTTVLIQYVLGFALALMVWRDLAARRLFRVLFLIPMMTTPVVMSVLWRTIFHESLGPLNPILESLGIGAAPWLSSAGWAFAAVVIVEVWQWTPFIFILSLAALQSLPRSALEAARIDGATGWQTILYIKLPLMLPVLIVTMLLRLIDAFKVLEVILVMTNGGPGLATEILSLRINRTASEFRALGEAAAMSNILLMVLMSLTLAMFLYTKAMEARARAMRSQNDEEA